MESFTADYGEATTQPMDGSSTTIDHLVCGGKVMLNWNIVVLILSIVLLLGCFGRRVIGTNEYLDADYDVLD